MNIFREKRRSYEFERTHRFSLAHNDGQQWVKKSIQIRKEKIPKTSRDFRKLLV